MLGVTCRVTVLTVQQLEDAVGAKVAGVEQTVICLLIVHPKCITSKYVSSFAMESEGRITSACRPTEHALSICVQLAALTLSHTNRQHMLCG